MIETLPFWVLFVFLWEHAVFQLQCGVYVFVGSTGTCLVETFPEVVAQERVKNGVDGGIGITKAGYQHVQRYIKSVNKWKY